MALPGSFALGEVLLPLPIHSKQGNHFSPCDPGDPQAACYWDSALLSHRNTAHLPKHEPGNVADF